MQQTIQTTARPTRRRLVDKPAMTAAEKLYADLSAQTAENGTDADIENLLNALDHFITAHRR